MCYFPSSFGRAKKIHDMWGDIPFGVKVAMEKAGARVLAWPIDMRTGKLLEGSALDKWQKTSGGFKFIETDEDLKRGFQLNGNDVQLGDKMPSAMWVRKKKNPALFKEWVAIYDRASSPTKSVTIQEPDVVDDLLAEAISAVAPSPPKKDRTTALLTAFCKKKGYKLVSPRNTRLKLWQSLVNQVLVSTEYEKREAYLLAVMERSCLHFARGSSGEKFAKKKNLALQELEKAKKSGRSMWQLFNIAQGGKKSDGLRRSFKLNGKGGFCSVYKMDHAVFKTLDNHPFVYQAHNSLNNVLRKYFKSAAEEINDEMDDQEEDNLLERNISDM